MPLLNRFPKKDQIIPVYAVGVTILYSWTIFTTFRDVDTNWHLYFDVTDILNLLAYVIAGTFLESLILIGILLLISFILPKNTLTEKFVLHGTILIITFLGSIMFLYTKTLPSGVLENVNLWCYFFIAPTILLILLGEFLPFFRKVVELIADRCTVFLYVYMPISFLSMIIIMIRNVS